MVRKLRVLGGVIEAAIVRSKAGKQLFKLIIIAEETPPFGR